MSPEIKNLKKAALRILKAIKKEEKIILYGDADLDGVTAIIILKETIQTLGGKIAAVYFPNREVEGYGITETALDLLKDKSPALLITVDCGIGNFKEIKLANQLGFKVIILDHHEVLDKVPEAEVIVDPKQKSDKYPFKGLSSAGIVFKLSELLFQNKMSKNFRENFLELAALSTIADMMPRTNENETMINDGLGYIELSWRPGIQALFNLTPLKSLDLDHKVSKIISILNVRDVENKLPAAFRILTSSEKEVSEKLAKRLYEKHLQRKEEIEIMIDNVEKRILGRNEEPLIFEGDARWEEAFFGVAASIISQKYQKPVFLYKKLKDESQASIRAPSGYNVVEAMKPCSKYLITFGGHPQAAGFRIKNENLEKFKKCLTDYFSKKAKRNASSSSPPIL